MNISKILYNIPVDEPKWKTYLLALPRFAVWAYYQATTKEQP